MTSKKVIVTGAAGIIGSHVCKGFLETGASVALFDRDEKALTELHDTLKPQPGAEIMPVPCDVSDPVSVKEAVGQVVKKWGQIDVLHNNAAWKSDDKEGFFADFENYDLQIWRKIMAVNVDGMMLMAQAVGKQMITQEKGGSIIQTASIYGVVAPDQRIYEGSSYMGGKISTPAVYSASKGAVIALTKYLSTYWASKNIRVNSVTPGGVESGQNETFKKQYSQRVPMGRMAQAEEIVGAVIFLASDAASYITGQNIIVDGGLTVW